MTHHLSKEGLAGDYLSHHGSDCTASKSCTTQSSQPCLLTATVCSQCPKDRTQTIRGFTNHGLRLPSLSFVLSMLSLPSGRTEPASLQLGCARKCPSQRRLQPEPRPDICIRCCTQSLLRFRCLLLGHSLAFTMFAATRKLRSDHRFPLLQLLSRGLSPACSGQRRRSSPS